MNTSKMGSRRVMSRSVNAIATTLARIAALAFGVSSTVVDAQQPAPRVIALAPATSARPVEIELQSAMRAAAPGDTVAVAIRLRPQPGWHAYWRHAGDVGSPPSIEWRLPNGYTAAPLRWPTPELISSPPLASYGYQREVHMLGAVHIPRSARIGSTATIAGTVTWVVCKDECFADEVNLAFTLPVKAARETDSVVTRAIAAEDARVPAGGHDWQFRSAVNADTIVLRARPPVGSRLLAGVDANHVRFFVDSSAVIDHAASQHVRVVGGELELRLVRSTFATTIPTRLTGVLTLDDRRGDDAASSGEHVGAAGKLAFEVDAPVVAMSQLASNNEATDAHRVTDASFDVDGWMALVTAGLLAFLGGTLLNLMPCVLPVLSIKALGVAEAAAHDAKTARRHTVFFSAGVLASMWALVATLLALRAVGTEVGWGYQLQSPVIVGALALIVFAAALNMLGVFELSPIGGSLAAASSRTPPAAEAFLSGVLVTALATPCSAPFLAAAVAYGIAGGAATAVIVFTAMALGLVWPLALVALIPRVRQWLPRPGAWMVTLRQVLAFPLLATVVWLAWVFGRQSGVGALTLLLAAMTLLSFGLWALGHFGTFVSSTRRRRAAHAIVLASSGGALALVILGANSLPIQAATVGAARANSIATDGALSWRPYNAATLDALRDSGRMVLVDFTADWCLTCKVNERVAFGADAVRSSLRMHDVALLRADWTTRDPIVTRALAEFNRNSVPFVVLYGRDRHAAPVILPTLLTPGIVQRALDDAASGISKGASALSAR